MLLYASRFIALILHVADCCSFSFHQARETDSEESKKVNRVEDMDRDITDDSDSN